jgi:hypothetical protein
MRTLSVRSRNLRDRIIVALIEAEGPIPTRAVERAVGSRTDVYAHLCALEKLGVVAKSSLGPEFRDVWWQYIGDDLARSGIVDLDT